MPSKHRAERPEGSDDLRFVATDGPVIGSLCTGVAGLDIGVASVLGGRIAWYCDTDTHASRILAARLPGAPNLGDLREGSIDTGDSGLTHSDQVGQRGLVRIGS